MQPDTLKKKNHPKNEMKESEPVFTERRELKDKNGRLMCEIETDFVGSKFHTPKGLQELKIRELTGLRLKRDGKTIDIFNLIDLHEKIGVYMSETFVPAAVGPASRKMILPPMDTPLRIAVALHEFGHAKQHEQPFFKKLYMRGVEDKKQMSQVSSFYRRVKTLMPEWSGAVPSDEVLDEMDKLEHQDESKQDEEMILRRRRYFLLEQLEEVLDINEYKKIQNDIDELKELEKQLSVVIDAGRNRLKAIMKLFPLHQSYMQKYGERDATKRAFKWMREINDQIQVDFSMMEEDEPLLPESLKQHCIESVQKSMKNVRQLGGMTVKGFLLKMLTTYDALDKIPVPSLRLLEQLEREEEKAIKKSSGS
ncbi:MAG: hypothetical protein NTX72_04540 [Candidatus Uhrbacteria bacterium]|nr:hypothetical protein [Candidatus Uhrbacteria bacterium]